MSLAPSDARSYTVDPGALRRASRECQEVSEKYGQIVRLCQAQPLPKDGAPPLVRFAVAALGLIVEAFVTKGTRGQQRFSDLAERLDQAATHYRQVDELSGEAFGRVPANEQQVFRPGTGTQPGAQPGTRPVAVEASAVTQQQLAAERGAVLADLTRLRAAAEHIDDESGREVGRDLRKEPLLQAAHDYRLVDRDAPLEPSLRDRYEAVRERADGYSDRVDALTGSGTAAADPARLAELRQAQQAGQSISDDYEQLKDDIARARRVISAGLVDEDVRSA